MQDVRASERHGSGKTMSDGLLVVREDLNTYDEVKVSSERDRYVRVKIGKLQSLQEKLK